MIRITVDTDDLEKLEKALGRFQLKAAPYIIRNTLNNLAFETRKEAQKNIRQRFHLRNSFTVQNVIVTKVEKGATTHSMKSHVGALRRFKSNMAINGGNADYMREQEFGHTETRKGKHGLPIPTSDASNTPKQRPPPKLPTRANRLRNINNIPRQAEFTSGSKNRGEAARKTVYAARKARKNVVFLDLEGAKGLYRIKRRKSLKRIRGRVRDVTEIRMIWSFEKETVTLKPRRWLGDAKDKVMRKDFARIYGEQLKRQIRFHFDRKLKRS